MADYSIPSWLTPGASAIPAQLLAQTLQARDQVAMHKQQLEQAARQSAIETDLQGRKLMLDQERLAGESAHQTALLTLHQAEADRAQQTLDMQARQHAANISQIQTRERLATEDAARKTMARQQFQQMTTDPDPAKRKTAAEAYALLGPELGVSPASALSAIRSSTEIPLEVQEKYGKHFFRGARGWQQVSDEGGEDKMSPFDRAAIQQHQRELAQLAKDQAKDIVIEGNEYSRTQPPGPEAIKRDPQIVDKWKRALSKEAVIINHHQDEIARLNPAYRMPGTNTATGTNAPGGAKAVYDPKRKAFIDPATGKPIDLKAPQSKFDDSPGYQTDSEDLQYN